MGVSDDKDDRAKSRRDEVQVTAVLRGSREDVSRALEALCQPDLTVRWGRTDRDSE